jgi:hypothetical protein
VIIDWIFDRIAHAVWAGLFGPLLFWAAVFFGIVVAARVVWLYLRD